MTSPVRVMIVDDSAVVRGLIGRWLSEADGVEVAGYAVNGAQAVRLAARGGVDIVLLDIEMPEMDGLAALERLRHMPLKVVMSSSLTTRHARLSFKALSMGAVDFIAKPRAASGGLHDAEGFRRELIEKVLAHGGGVTWAAPARPVPPPAGPDKSTELAGAPRESPFTPRRTRVAPRIVSIGGSTGGPQALFTLLARFPLARKVPVVIAQHMPATFTAMLAKHLGEVSGIPAAEAEQGEPLEPGRIYVAPGGYHLRVAREAAGFVARLDQSPPVNFCRPAVDPLFESIAEAAGASAVAILLTGMGSDGAVGAGRIRRAGGLVAVQDKATSVVWGMPGAAVAAGAVDTVLPIGEMASGIAALLSSSRRLEPGVAAP